MKTTFLLHGGASSKRSPENKKFFNTIINSVNKNSVNILCVYFTRPEHRWDESFFEDRYAFESENSPKDLIIEIASYENFAKQLEGADVLFINGGFKGRLKEAINNLSNFSELIKGKTVVGISAGANILSTYYFSQGIHDIREGAAILTIKVFCHYDDSLKDELKLLADYKEDLPIYKIPEEEFKVITF